MNNKSWIFTKYQVTGFYNDSQISVKKSYRKAVVWLVLTAKTTTLETY